MSQIISNQDEIRHRLGAQILSQAAHIQSLITWHSGGGIMLDLIELKDGRVLGISDDCVILYKSLHDFLYGENAELETAGRIEL